MSNRDGLAAGLRVQLAEDRRHVVVDGSPRDDEPLRNLGVAETQAEESQHLILAGGEARRIRLRAAP